MLKPIWMLKNSSGKKSISLTLAVIASFIVLIKFTFSGIHFKFAGIDILFSDINPALLATFISPFLALYFGRRKSEQIRKPQSPSDACG